MYGQICSVQGPRNFFLITRNSLNRSAVFLNIVLSMYMYIQVHVYTLYCDVQEHVQTLVMIHDMFMHTCVRTIQLSSTTSYVCIKVMKTHCTVCKVRELQIKKVAHIVYWSLDCLTTPVWTPPQRDGCLMFTEAVHKYLHQKHKLCSWRPFFICWFQFFVTQFSVLLQCTSLYFKTEWRCCYKVFFFYCSPQSKTISLL